MRTVAKYTIVFGLAVITIAGVAPMAHRTGCTEPEFAIPLGAGFVAARRRAQRRN